MCVCINLTARVHCCQLVCVCSLLLNQQTNYITQNPRLTTEPSSGTFGSIMAASVRKMVGVCEDSSSSDDEALRRCQEAVWDTRRDTNTGETFSC